MKIAKAFLFILFSNVASADCYLVGHLTGYQATVGNDYEFVRSGFSDQEFQINIDGPRSFVSPRGKDTCSEINRTAIDCSFIEGSKGLYEVWSIDLSRNIVIFTKHRSGFEHGLDGGVVFKGKVIGKCK